MNKHYKREERGGCTIYMESYGGVWDGMGWVEFCSSGFFVATLLLFRLVFGWMDGWT